MVLVVVKASTVGTVKPVGTAHAGETVHYQHVALAATGLVEFETCNPITKMMKDNKTGYFREDILDERVYSAILEFPVRIEKFAEVLNLVKEIATKTETLFSLDACSLTHDGQDEKVEQIMRDCGIDFRPNGKVNLGLGKPFYQIL